MTFGTNSSSIDGTSKSLSTYITSARSGYNASYSAEDRKESNKSE